MYETDEIPILISKLNHVVTAQTLINTMTAALLQPESARIAANRVAQHLVHLKVDTLDHPDDALEARRLLQEFLDALSKTAGTRSN